MIRGIDVVGSHDIIWITLDSLRYDVARDTMAAGRTPNLARFLPNGWEERHTSGSFTLPAHLAFLSGFLPTPPGARRPARTFCGRFDGAVGARDGSFIFDEPSLPQALAARGYRTVCVGGVGFFSGTGALGRTIPGLFQESRWSRASGPSNRGSAAVQKRWMLDILATTPRDQRLFCLWNVAATHTPTHPYLPGARQDSPDTQAAALADTDSHLGEVLAALHRPSMVVICADHGDCFGEDGLWGHGIAHRLVWTVPYAEVLLT